MVSVSGRVEGSVWAGVVVPPSFGSSISPVPPLSGMVTPSPPSGSAVSGSGGWGVTSSVEVSWVSSPPERRWAIRSPKSR